MSSNENRLPYAIAAEAAKAICTSMKPFCHKIAVAGSLRRRKETVGDIEIVAVPKWITEPDHSDLFAERTLDVNLLFCDWANTQTLVRWIKPGKTDESGEAIEWGVKPDGRYWRGLLNNIVSSTHMDCKVDIFLTSPERWGVRYMLSTGSAEFNAYLIQHANRVGFEFSEGHLWQVGWKGKATFAGDGDRSHGQRTRIDTFEEADVFRELGLEFIPPHLRRDRDDVRTVSRKRSEATHA